MKYFTMDEFYNKYLMFVRTFQIFVTRIYTIDIFLGKIIWNLKRFSQLMIV